MTPDAPSSAIPITTFIIIFLPPLGFPVAIIIPPMIIKTNEVIKISVTNILVKLHIKVGKAVAQVTLVSSEPLFAELSSIHLPINGTDVLSSIPQQTHFILHEVQIPSTFLVPSGHVHTIQFETHHTGGLHEFHEPICAAVHADNHDIVTQSSEQQPQGPLS